MAYDAFGMRRNPDWTQANGALGAAPPADTRVAYTGHEADDEDLMVDMGARAYLPALKRFAAPDTVVETPTYGPSWNRYAYVYDDPMNRTDPTGHAGTGDDWGPEEWDLFAQAAATGNTMTTMARQDGLRLDSEGRIVARVLGGGVEEEYARGSDGVLRRTGVTQVSQYEPTVMLSSNDVAKLIQGDVSVLRDWDRNGNWSVKRESTNGRFDYVRNGSDVYVVIRELCNGAAPCPAAFAEQMSRAAWALSGTVDGLDIHFHVDFVTDETQANWSIRQEGGESVVGGRDYMAGGNLTRDPNVLGLGWWGPRTTDITAAHELLHAFGNADHYREVPTWAWSLPDGWMLVGIRLGVIPTSTRFDLTGESGLWTPHPWETTPQIYAPILSLP